jgi:hypothetical protein
MGTLVPGASERFGAEFQQKFGTVSSTLYSKTHSCFNDEKRSFYP